MSPTSDQGALQAIAQGSLPATQIATWTPRFPLAAKCGVDKIARRTSMASLRIESSGLPACYGGWEVTFANVAAGATYLVEAHCRSRDVADLVDSAPLEVFWRDASGKQLDHDYVLS